MKKAFSLVELSFTIVLIALLTGLVVSAKNLYDQSNIRKFASDLELHKSNILVFRDKYTYWPGDLPNASSMWTGATSGNGNGFLVSPETYHGWNHLFNSGFYSIPYNYSNFSSNYGLYAPKSSIGNINYFYFVSLDSRNSIGISTLYNIYGSEGVILTSYSTSSSNGISSISAYYLDLKVDDGDPTRGKIITYPHLNNTSGTCVSGTLTSPGSATYILSNSSTNSCATGTWIETKFFSAS